MAMPSVPIEMVLLAPLARPDSRLPPRTITSRAIKNLLGAMLIAIVGCRPALPPRVDIVQRLAIVHVSLFAGADTTLANDMTVLTNRDRIEAVGPFATIRIPDGTTVVDGTDRFLIPGLWDMHTHVALAGESALTALITYGITSVRDMGGSPALIRPWASDIANGSRIGPSIEFTSPVLESASWLRRVRQIHLPGFEFPNPAWELNPSLGVADGESARLAVDSVERLGSAYVKFRTLESRSAFFAIARASRAKHLQLVGHSPTPVVSLADASDSGLASIEHMDFKSELDSLSPQQRSALYARLNRNRTWLDPTLVSGIVSTMPDTALTSLLLAEVRTGRSGSFEPLHLLSAQMLESFRRDLFVRNRGGSNSTTAEWAAALAHLREMRRAGVRFLAGSDLGALWVFPGPSLHDELEMLVKDIGFTPSQVLRIATHDAAEFSGQLSDVGTVETAKRADMVLLDKNPLVDIQNTRRIVAVVVRGHLFDRTTLAVERRRVIERVRAP
jgi:hypothetical protein